MSSKEKHPHIEMPSKQEIKELLQEKEPDLRKIYLAIHDLILELMADVKYSIDCKDGIIAYGLKQYGYDGWGMAALAAHSKWVSLMFMQGVNLEDQGNLLEGTGKKMRHIKLKSLQDFSEHKSNIIGLIKEAAKIKQS